jgi:hypothetical protein
MPPRPAPTVTLRSPIPGAPGTTPDEWVSKGSAALRHLDPQAPPERRRDNSRPVRTPDGGVKRRRTIFLSAELDDELEEHVKAERERLPTGVAPTGLLSAVVAEALAAFLQHKKGRT